MYGNYINTITSIIGKYAPISKRKCTKKQCKTWFNEEALKLKIQRRRAENNWQASKVNYIKGNIFWLINVTSDTYIKQKRKF